MLVRLSGSRKQHLDGKKHTKFAQRQQEQIVDPFEPNISTLQEDRTEKCQLYQKLVFVLEMATHIEVDLKEGVDFGVVVPGDEKE